LDINLKYQTGLMGVKMNPMQANNDKNKSEFHKFEESNRNCQAFFFGKNSNLLVA